MATEELDEAAEEGVDEIAGDVVDGVALEVFEVVVGVHGVGVEAGQLAGGPER